MIIVAMGKDGNRMVCKDCVYYNVCTEDGDFVCELFINKNNFVEVVRCKDCKFANYLYSLERYLCKKGCGATKKDNDFCSYGEKK